MKPPRKKIVRKMWAIKWPSGLIQVYPKKLRAIAAIEYWGESMVRPYNSYRLFRCELREISTKTKGGNK